MALMRTRGGLVGFNINALRPGMFKTKRITDPLERAQERALRRTGAFIRTNVRRRKLWPIRSYSKKRKGAGDLVSSPGRPPYVHTNNPNATLRKVLFDVDMREKKVIVGPVLLNTTIASRAGLSCPEALEKGGTAVTVLRFANPIVMGNTGPRNTQVVRGFLTSRMKTFQMSRRPFMKPAMEEEAPKLSEHLRHFYSREASRVPRSRKGPNVSRSFRGAMSFGPRMGGGSGFRTLR